MKILYCRVGYMNSYNGVLNDTIVNGGSYNKSNTGHEIYNFRNHNNYYYGYVQSRSKTINVSRLMDLENDKKVDFCTNILVVWVVRNKNSKGQRIVGWSKNATVYKKLKQLPKESLLNREDKSKSTYNIISSDVTLVNPNDRTKIISGIGQSNVWYGNDNMNQEVLSYIQDYDQEEERIINHINHNLENLVGIERATLIKTRVNQDKFRKLILDKYDKKCCLCGIEHEKILVASHINPWNKSNKHEKLNQDNGLLLCPNHDKLFDSGLISFDNFGTILISSTLSSSNCNKVNLHKNMKIDVNENNMHFIKYHRHNIFIK